MVKFIFCILFMGVSVVSADLIQINKQGVLHSFVRTDPDTDTFIQNAFQNWEPETFDVFERFQDKESIAIDIGAWIGTTAIWLADRFYHVVAVECDARSLECLFNNLLASGCSNVSICDRPVAQLSEPVIFGPRGDKLNLSTSYVKKWSDSDQDYAVKSITIKQLLFDYVYSDEAIKSRRISFIKCDIEGGEENILEDLLHFAYNNQVTVYLSFHLSWWQSHSIDDFDSMFRFFNISLPDRRPLGTEEVNQYIRLNPFASLLFEPKNEGAILVKKNMPVLIITYNLVTFTRDMVDQLEKYTSDIMIVDNCSTYQPLLDYYQNEYPYTLFRQKENFGHRVYQSESMQKLLGDLYIVTDPDLKFNPNLPDDFLERLVAVQNHFHANRVGFALGIDFEDMRTDNVGQNAVAWERKFWEKKVLYDPDPSLELYEAGMDTTFCLINRVYERFYPYFGIRVAGDYTCKHLPWHKNFDAKFAKGEYEAYLMNNVSTNYFKK